jgi:plasmid stabilization system protein ParE
MQVTLHPGAETDLEDAAVFDEGEASPALAARFITAFGRIVQLQIENPAIGAPRSRGRRGFR